MDIIDAANNLARLEMQSLDVEAAVLVEMKQNGNPT